MLLLCVRLCVCCRVCWWSKSHHPCEWQKSHFRFTHHQVNWHGRAHTLSPRNALLPRKLYHGIVSDICQRSYCLFTLRFSLCIFTVFCLEFFFSRIKIWFCMKGKCQYSLWEKNAHHIFHRCHMKPCGLWDKSYASLCVPTLRKSIVFAFDQRTLRATEQNREKKWEEMERL